MTSLATQITVEEEGVMEDMRIEEDLLGAMRSEGEGEMKEVEELKMRVSKCDEKLDMRREDQWNMTTQNTASEDMTPPVTHTPRYCC